MAQPIILNDVTLLVDGTAYEADVSQVQFDPTTGVVRWKGMKPGSGVAFGTDSDWAATFAFAQDWEDDDSLSVFLYENEGERVPVTFKPKKSGQASWTTTLVVAPGTIGGQVDTVAVASVTVGCDRPVRVAP